ncbi:molybdopterin-guanine dinucleotide biosynthesis protein B [Macrococcus equi]|uniref:molybdopterin-guanine dinucleotide biosynthesis protein B n=1 Tax=Macrococcus equi TaxID=3395462 RepID=UPI0039BE66F4
MVKILQVTGYKKSGKTTTMNTIIRLLKSKGLKVAVIKHHGDKGVQDIDIPKRRDHISYMDNGADESIVQGHQYIHKLLKFADEEAVNSLEHIIAHEVTTNPDVILIEGFKYATYDKIVLFNKDDDKKELINLSNIQLMLDTSEERNRSNKILEAFINKWVDDTRETI